MDKKCVFNYEKVAGHNFILSVNIVATKATNDLHS